VNINLSRTGCSIVDTVPSNALAVSNNSEAGSTDRTNIKVTSTTDDSATESETESDREALRESMRQQQVRKRHHVALGSSAMTKSFLDDDLTFEHKVVGIIMSHCAIIASYRIIM
jgi:hypothetical protein